MDKLEKPLRFATDPYTFDFVLLILVLFAMINLIFLFSVNYN
jgi:hypothetical protein